MKSFILLIACILMLFTEVHSFEIQLLQNNKESFSRILRNNESQDAHDWALSHPLKDALKDAALKTLSDTFEALERKETTCDLGVLKKLQIDARDNGVITTKEEVLLFITWLRVNDYIDDIFFQILRNSTHVNLDLEERKNYSPSRRPFNLYTRQNAGIDLEKFYEPVKTWPNDIDECSINTYFELVDELKWKNSRDRDGQMYKLNWMAYNHGVIDLETYNNLETLRRHRVLDWDVYFRRYIDVIKNAKDKMTKAPEPRSENDFGVEYVSREEGITQRVDLYRRYDSTQIVMLAQIIEKAAKRMDSRLASIHWQYTDDPEGETEIYVLSPMEQYRAAIKMLRKDLAEVMRSDAFRSSNIEYEHLIAAAYETGFIRSEELDYILRFEDFWNPKTPKWKAYANFAFDLAGSAAFFLPPPWNIVGAVGLVLTQSKIVNGGRQPDPDDNWNVIL